MSISESARLAEVDGGASDNDDDLPRLGFAPRKFQPLQATR